MTDLDYEVSQAIKIVRVLLDSFEDRIGVDDPSLMRDTLIKLTVALAEHGQPKRASKKELRGVGYTMDEAWIVASIPEHGSIAAAVRAHCPEYPEDAEYLKSVERRLRERKKQIDEWGIPDVVGKAEI